MPFSLPLEIEETILNHLAKIDGLNHTTLNACSRVCRAFLPICRKHIFGRIDLRNIGDSDEDTKPFIDAFERLLRETPQIADYIHILSYNLRVEDLTIPSIQLEESFKRISKLKSLSIWNDFRLEFSWDDNPIRPALLHLLHLPSLTFFRMNHINDFVVSDLIPCVNLKHMDIGNFLTAADENTFPAALPENSIQLDEFQSGIGTSALIMELCSARRPDGLPIIDFRSLSKLRVCPAILEELHEGEELEISQELLRHCHDLTEVTIAFSYVRPSLADMLRPFMQTLRKITLDIEVDGDDVDPLFGIPSELEDMRSKNIIEIIDMHVTFPTGGNCRRGDDWRRLDEVLTAPGWFSLKEVILMISIDSDYDRTWDNENDDSELVAALQKLPAQFPRLSSSKTILFDLAI